MQPTIFNKQLQMLFVMLTITFSSFSQNPVPFQVRYQRTLKGDATIVANNIVNRRTATETTAVPYNGNTANDSQIMEYIDIDSDATTFSSSSATLTIPDQTCSKVVYAGLYWSAVYKYNGVDASTGRDNNFNNIKLKIPGSTTYLDISGIKIFDGFTNANFSFNSPYTCYADVTNIIAAMANPNGVYTVANVRATQNTALQGGISGGWNLFVVYENPLMPGRYITSYDGFAGVNAALGSLDINYSGFITAPAPLPVRAKIFASALEGDKSINGDRLQFKASSLPTFNDLFNGLNAANNFFNSTISNLDASSIPYITTDRTPNSENTLGYDTDVIAINQTLLPNSETAATFRMTSTQDQYYLFFNSLVVDNIEPDINLLKTVQNISGVDIGGQNVNLGQVLDYVINFQNVGNDNATSFFIKDILPVNTFFQSVDLSGAPGVTYVYDPVLGKITFSIPDNLVEIGDPSYTIRIRVQVVTTCSELTDACSNIIQNQAFATYQGVLNPNQITDDPSFATINTCGAAAPGPSNFLVDIDDCTFTRNETLCGSSLVLTAGDGYASYQWFNSSGVNIGNTQSITVTAPGNYYVINTPTPPCIGITEYINVSFFGTTTTNPIIPFADEVVICPNNGEQLPNIFLCGLNDSQLIQTNITDAVSIIWEQLNESSCPAVGIEDCANTNPICQWNQVGTGSNFLANQAGQYRVIINYQNGCFIRYYFNVYKNLLDPQFIVQNIVCNTPGSITVTNVPTNYEFQLVDQTTNTILVPYQSNPNFVISTAGSYLVQIKQQGVTDGCIFTLPNIGVLNQNLTLNLIPTNETCNQLGSIRVQALNVVPQYYFSITGPVSANFGPSSDNDYTFTNLPAGTYNVTVTTDDGCNVSSSVTINDLNPVSLNAQVSQHISCDEGNIQVNPQGGNPPYLYAIYSYNGVLQNPQPNDFQTSVIFDIPFGAQGDYVFIVIDRDNCTALSNLVTIDLIPDVSYTTTVTNVTCNGQNNGSIVYNVGNSNGYNTTFQLLDSTGNLITQNFSGNFTGLAPGNYTVVLIQTKGNKTCSFPFNFTITAPAPIVGSIIQTLPYTCINSSGATISVDLSTVSGGTAPYTYSLDGINFSNISTFTNLTAGNYVATIKDANGCIYQTNAITVAPLNPPTDINFTVSNPTCPTLQSNVTLSVVGGNLPFNYQITAPAAFVQNNGTNPIFNNLNPGTYTFTVTDNLGCVYSENLTIPNITPITVNGQLIQNVACFGASNGALQFNVSGFSSNYSYTILNSAGVVVGSSVSSANTTINLSGLIASNYIITVTDNLTNCTSNASVLISNPSAALTLNVNVQPITCISNGSVNANVTGGWGSNSYQLLLPNATIVGPQSSPIFSNLTLLGTYTLTVTDGGNCSISQNFSLTIPTNPSLNIAASSDLCFDNTNNATITVSVTGGLAPFSYQINGGSFQSSPTFSNLTPGSYTIQVVDANGCTASINQVINNQLIAVPVITKNLDCTSSPEAQIQVNISGGQSPFSYQASFNGGAFGSLNAVVGSSFTYTATNPGTYQFLITDNIGCTTLTSTITINPITNPTISLLTQSQPILCNGASTGAITISLDPNFGLTPFTITVVNTTTGVNYGSQLTGLPAGGYLITVTDSNSCSTSGNINITQPNQLSYNVNTVDITCTATGTSLGQINVENVIGGTAPYTYYLSNNFGYSDSFVSATGLNHSFPILSFGVYTIDVVDANGCSVVTNNINIASPPSDLTIDLSTVTVDCSLGGTATITVSTAVSSGSYEFAILEFNTLPYSSSYQPANAGTPETSTFTGLIPGIIYTFVVHDLVTNCYYFKTANAPISTPTNMILNINGVRNVTCTGNADGNVTFTFSNYSPTATQVNYEIFNAQSNISTGFTGVANPLSGGAMTISNFGTLAPGNYYILVTEIGGTYAGCSAATNTFTITQSTNLLTVNATVVKNDNCNANAGIISAIGQFGTAPYQYQLVPVGNPAPTESTWTGSSNNIFNAEGGNYIVYIMDANFCIQSTPITLPTDSSPSLSLSLLNTCNTINGQFSIQVNRLNGIAPFSYNINGGASFVQLSNSFTINNLISGSYTITVSDSNGCTDTENIIINAPLSISTLVANQPFCSINNGEIITSVTGGSGSYLYSLNDNLGNPIVTNQASATFTGLGAGSYAVIVNDVVTGCQISSNITLNTPTPVVFTASTTNVSCFNGNNGSILVNLSASNNNPPYIYQISNGIDPTITQNNPLFTNLNAGTYTITVTSDRQCTLVQVVQITEPTQLSISATATDFACDINNVVQFSTITVNVVNDAFGQPTGTAPYLYSIDGINYFTTNNFSVADNGSIQNLTVFVKDNNNCIQTSVVTINPLPTITSVSAMQVTGLTCTNTENVLVTVTGGSGDFTFEILPAGSYPSVLPGSGVYSANFNINNPGNYSFIVTDNVTGCYLTAIPYIINPINTITAQISNPNAVSCFGANDGDFELNVSGYSGNYNWSLYNSSNVLISNGTANTSTNPIVIPNIGGGLYYVTVTATDSPFCSTNSNNLTIPSPTSPLALVANEVANVTCTNNLGEILANATGGWGNYEFELINISTSTTIQNFNANHYFTGLSAGQYQISVRDLEGCTITQIINLTQPTLINGVISASSTSLLCYGDQNATIQVNGVTGGQGVYQFSLNYYDQTGTTIVSSTGFQISNIFNYLGAGTYSVTITDGWNCSFTSPTITITEPTELSAILTVTSSLTCTNQAQISIIASGGTAPFMYSADGINYTNTSIFNVSAGTYQYYVKDANNCAAVLTNSVVINSIAPLNLNLNLTGAIIYCTGESSATIISNATGGLGNYLYQLLDNAGNVIIPNQNSGIFSNLPAGNYVVTVTSVDCIASSNVIQISNPTQLMASATKTDVVCFGESNGTITVSATGGTGIIQYAISPNLDQFTANNVFTGLFPGTYDIIVQDQNGCFVTLQVTILEPVPVQAVISSTTNELCYGDANGTITINFSGGTGGYQISLDGTNYTPVTGNQHTLTNLTGNNFYLIYITDNNNCFINPPLEYFMPAAAVLNPITTVTTTCNNNTIGNIVTIDVDPSSIGAVTYSLDDVNYTSSNIFNNLLPGTYTAYVLHNNGCKKTTSFTIANIPQLISNVTSTNVLCFGESNGSITVNASGGSGNYLYGISPSFTMGSSSIFTGLSAGTYTIKTEDSNGCTINEDITITQPNALNVSLVNVFQEICENDNNGAIEVSISGGTAPYGTSLSASGPFNANQFIYQGLNGGNSYTIYVKDANNCTTQVQVTLDVPIIINASEIIDYGCDSNIVIINVNSNIAANVTYSLDGGPDQSSNTFNNLSNGPHTVMVEHSAGCFETVDFVINNPTPLSLTLSQTTFNQVIANALGGQSPYTFYINDYNNGSNNVLSYYQSGTYEIKVIDANGCEASVMITVEFVDIIIVNVLTPNDDGQNDTWSPQNTQNYPNIKTDIFDRYGRKVKTLFQGEVWDGTYNGNKLPTGDYWYIIKLGNPNDDRDFVGNFTIYR